MAQRRVTVRIEGVVQGVWFRDYSRREADRLALSGFVRNLPDGAVEVVLEGAAGQVAAMIRWLHRGSPQAIVKQVRVVEEKPLGEEGIFSIRYDCAPS
jgi:acylphosphatase